MVKQSREAQQYYDFYRPMKPKRFITNMVLVYCNHFLSRFGIIMNLTLSPDEMAVIKLSYQIASVSLLVNLLPAIAMGWLLARKDFFWQVFV